MLRRILPYYLFYVISRITGTLLILSASVIFIIILSPFRLPLFVLKTIASVILSLYTFKVITDLSFKNFLWKLEQSNPFLNENLISYFELKKEKNTYSELLRKRVEKAFDQKLHLYINLQKEIKVLAFSIIFLLLMLSLFPSKYSGLERVRRQTIFPSFIVTTTDSTIHFKSARSVAFYVRKGQGGKEFIKRDTLLSISFKEPGRYYIWGEAGGVSTLYSIAKVVKKPEIDSFAIITPRGIFKNQKWVTVQSSSEITVLVYSVGSSIKIFSQETLAKKGDNLVKAKLKVTEDIVISAEIYKEGITRKLTLCRISSLPNLPPKIVIKSPSSLYSYVPEDMQLKISGKAYDEDGIKVIYLNYFLRGILRRIKIIPKSGAEITFTFNIDLNKEGMLPGDQLTFYILAEDSQGAPDSTETYYVIFPTLEEIYKQEASKVSETAFKFIEGVREFSGIQAKLEEFGDSLKLGIQEKEKTIEGIQNLVEDIAQITREFENIMEVLEDAKRISLSPELLEKMRVVGEELYNLLKNEFPELEKKLQELKNLGYPENLKKWEEIQKQSSEILERLSYLEKIIEMAKKEMALKEIEEKIENLIAKRQNLLEKGQNMDFSQIETEEAKLQSEFHSTFNNIEDNLKDLGVNFDFGEFSQKILKKQSEILNSARTKDRKSLKRLQNEQMEDLKGLLKSFRNLKESTVQQEIAKLLEIIGSIRRTLIATSYSLEENLTNKQFIPYIIRSLERVRMMVREAGPLILMASSRVPKLLDMAKDSIYNNPTLSLNLINSAIFELFRIQAQASMKDKEGGEGLDAMKFLENLMKRQAQMINETADAISLPIPIPQFQQSLLEKTIELKNRLISMYMSASNNEVREQIEKALQEIQKTEEKLRKGEFDKDLIESQRKTLKHMLDAHGIYKREEFTQRRYAEPAKPFEFKPPETTDRLNIDKLHQNLAELEKFPPFERKILRQFYINLLRKF